MEIPLDALSDRVPDRPERLKALFLTASSLRRVFKGPVQQPPRARKDWAGLVSVVADRNDVVEWFAEIPLQGL